MRLASSLATRAASFCSRDCAMATSLFLRASASARFCSKRKSASSPARFCEPISMRSFCRSSLVFTFCVTVRSVIFRMPSESMMLFGSSDSTGVCSRKSMAQSSITKPFRSLPMTSMIASLKWSRSL